MKFCLHLILYTAAIYELKMTYIYSSFNLKVNKNELINFQALGTTLCSTCNETHITC